MPNFLRPGVYVTETLTPSRAVTSPSPSVGAFLGSHFRGPTAAVLCQSWGDFVAFFGGFPPATPALANPWLAWAVYDFFNNGGQQCWVARLVASGTPGAGATHVFNDQAVTPLPTLSLTAANVGTWGNSLYVDVVARGTGTGRFDLNIYSGGSQPGNIVEKWVDLSIVPSDPRYVVSLLNSPTGGSLYVVAANLNSVTAAPNNAPAVVNQVQLSGGTDPGDPSVTDRTNAVTAGTSPLDQVTGLLNLNLPGETSTGVLNAALSYAQGRQNVFVVLDPPSGQTPAQAVTYLQSLNATSYGALYYPWLNLLDPSVGTPNAIRLRPPGGSILGQMARMDAQKGVWHAPAGLQARLTSVVGLERKFSNADLDNLNSNNVNAVKPYGSGWVIWGTRTMVNSVASMYVPIRRTLNYIEEALKTGLQWVIFEPNDVLLWATITQVVASFLTGLWQARGLAGSTAGDAFYVTCDATVNTPSSIQQGIVNTQVGVALQYPAEFVNLLIGQWQGGSSSSVVAS